MSTNETRPLRKWIDRDFVAALADDMSCPHCGKRLSPSFFRRPTPRDFDLICGHCHSDILRIEPLDAA
jgi:hypothetical protein